MHLNVKLHVHSLSYTLIWEYNCVRQTEKEQGERGRELFQTTVREFGKNNEKDHETGHL
jgi:hypothetical protein